MAVRLEDLNDAQARHAVQLFFDGMPDDAWEDDKPSADRVKTLVRALKEKADPADAEVLSRLTDDADPAALAAQAAIARLVLGSALESPTLAPVAQTAIDEAHKANMMLITATGLLIIGVLLATSKFRHGDTEVNLGGGMAEIVKEMRLPELLDKLPAVIKVLPTTVWSALGLGGK